MPKYESHGISMTDILHQRILDEGERRGAGFMSEVVRELLEERLDQLSVERAKKERLAHKAEVAKRSIQAFEENRSATEVETKVGFWGKLLGKDKNYV